MNRVFILIVNPIIIILVVVIVIFLLLMSGRIKNMLTRELYKRKLEGLEYNREFVKDILLYYGVMESLLGIHVNFIGYILLDFVNKKWLSYHKNSDNEYEYIINEKPNFKDNDLYEKELYNIVLYVAGKDYTLQKNELLNYMETPIGQLRLFYVKSMLKGESYNFLWENCYVIHSETNKAIKKRYDLFDYYSYSFSDKGREAGKKIYSLYRYIRDFTLLNEKGIEVENYWEDLFRYAVLFNLAEKIKEMIEQDKVEKAYKDIYERIIFKYIDTDKSKRKVLNQLDDISKEYKTHESIAKELFDNKFVNSYGDNNLIKEG